MTPAEMIHEAITGLMVSSAGVVLTERNFLELRSLLDSRDLRLICLTGSFSCTNLNVVGCVDGLLGATRSGVFSAFGLTAAAHESSVVRDARNAAS